MNGTSLSGAFLLLLLIFAVNFPAHGQKRAAESWSIADYVENLPEKYKTFGGDFSSPSAKTTIVDEANGYAAYLNTPPHPESNNPPFPIFEMALFKSQTKPPLVVVANRKSDSICTNYETFFLRLVGSKWTEVSREILPLINLKMFWDTAQSAERLLKIIKKSSASYHFEPPRQGTQMGMSLEICDFLEDDTPQNKAGGLSKLIETAKPIRLEWDKQNGKFKFAK